MTCSANAIPKTPYRVGILLVDGFSTLALGSTIEPLKIANQIAGFRLFEWITYSVRKRPVHTNEGFLVAADAALEESGDLDCALVIAGESFQHQCTNHHIRWLQARAEQGLTIGGICRGPFLLASAGLLDGVRIAAHPHCLSAIAAQFPKVLRTQERFHVESRRATAADSTAPLAMMLHLINEQHGQALTNTVAAKLNPSDTNHTSEEACSEQLPDKLLESITLMHNNIEEPIALEELAQYVSISRRQLERLYQRHLGCSPSRYYLKQRLDRARQLLHTTRRPILDIATACGFVSTPHFSRVYREHMGLSPRDERQAPRALAMGSATANQSQPNQPQANQTSAQQASSLRPLNTRPEPAFAL